MCVIGCGPIGLTAGLLLSRHGLEVTLVERRSELNTHPRSRFVDTNTMELLREFGLDEQVEQTGLGPDWTAYNRWSDNLAVAPYAEIPSPTFHAVPGPASPCLPVMTVQDEVEKALMSSVANDPNITVRFDTEVVGLTQTPTEARLTLRDVRTGRDESLTAGYVIGADGPASSTRDVIGAVLDGMPRPIYMQDVIFHADLDPYVGDRKGSLLYTQPPEGVLIFQPLDGRRRWRCQVAIGSAALLGEDAIRARILASLGTADDVELDIASMRMWQPTPGCTTRFMDRRICLAGDAAHVSVPTGGLGNNSGFSGIRNLAWKLAYVVRGLAPPSILDSYETEHRPVALERIAFGVATTGHMQSMMLGHRVGDDITEHVRGTHQYADYDHVLRGFELSSGLVDPEVDPSPDRSGEKFEPLVRTGRRAPHIWLDASRSRSVLDHFGRGFVLLVGPEADADGWASELDIALAANEPAARAVVGVRELPGDVDIAPYRADEVVLVRPDGVIAQRRPVPSNGPDLTDFVPYLPPFPNALDNPGAI